MVRQVKPPNEAQADLEKTDELLALDVAAYEAHLALSQPNDESTEPRLAAVSDTGCNESRPQPLAELPAPETLRDIEAWIAGQDARARTYARALAEMQTQRADAQARADNLALELEVAKKALHTALCRANDGERAALDKSAAAQLAESRAAEMQTELEATRGGLASSAERLAAAGGELARAHESLAARAREQEEMRQRLGELARTLEERSNRMTQLEDEFASLRADMAAADRELAQRAARIAAMHTENETQQAAAKAIARERDALAVRITRFVENAQSTESKRHVWEGMWRELDAELTDARVQLGRLETERAQFAATVAKVSAELVERDAAIAQLQAERTAQSTNLEELTASRAREQHGHAATTQELRVRGETLAAEIKALGERQRRSAAAVAAREAELAELRAARAAGEEALRTVKASAATHAARTAELEALASNVSQALQAQTEATNRATALIADRERELAGEHARATALETELQASRRDASELATTAQSTETALKLHVEQLAASRERVANLEREAQRQSERLAHLQVELAHAGTLAEQAEASRRPVENELARVQTELQRETERASGLDAAQRKLALELERTRGALDERELQLRRLERYATSSAQVLSRIRNGIERGSGNPPAETLETLAGGATLVPLDDSNAPALTLGRHTTIGRAPESDLCLKDSSVSRRHAVLTLGANGAFIEDLRSVNGVTVNRQRVRHARLADGDVIELGLRRFRFTAAPARSADAG